MKIAILSDSHGRHKTLSRALEEVRRRGIGLVMHCGDIEDRESVLLFAGLEAHFVLGNCDHDRRVLQRAVTEIRGTLHENFGHLEREGVRLAFLHGDDQGLKQDLENCGQYDFLFYGHTHMAAEHQVGPTRVINPGALHRAKVKTFAVLDLADKRLESVVVDD